MSRADDRIPVPGNGHGPSIDAPDTAAATDPAAPLIRPETTVVFTPGQLAVGFGIVASIILFVVGRRRRRR